MQRLSSTEEAQKIKDRQTLQMATSRPLSLIKTRRNTYVRGGDVPDEIDPASLLEVKARWNTYSPISQLPNETLVEVFMIVKDSSQCSFEDLHRLAQICGHWRRVAISTPALWTDLPTGRHNYTLLMLDRSKKAPLGAYLYKDIPAATTNAVLDHIERIRTLALDLPASLLIDAQSFLSGSNTRNALLLEELIISSHYHSRENLTFTFSLDTFRLTSKLCQLRLSGISFDWFILSSVPNLTHLILDGANASAGVSGKQFIRVLQQMSKLETLQMTFEKIRLYDYSSSTSSELIHLPSLTTLAVGTREKHDLLGHFLSHTSLPQLRKLRVQCDFHLGPYDFSPIIQAAATTLKNGRFDMPDVLNIGYNHFNMSFQKGQHKSESPSAIILLPFRSDERGADSDYAVIADVMNGGLFSSLVQVSIFRTIRLTREEFSRLFGWLLHLEHIKVYNDLFAMLIETLSISTDHPSNAPLTFPKLRSIMWVHRTPSSLTPDKYVDPALFNDLYNCLARRRYFNASIHTLDLVGCLQQEQIDQLEDVVDEVIVRNWQTYSRQQE
jgi:hypothetical protein